jgi:hypothetical protein
VAVWFAITPAGIEIIMAMEKPRAIITNNARIFLLEMFLIALFKTPMCFTFQSARKTDNQEGVRESDGAFEFGLR